MNLISRHRSPGSNSQGHRHHRLGSLNPIILGGIFLIICLGLSHSPAQAAESFIPVRQIVPTEQNSSSPNIAITRGLSPYWEPEIQQWGIYIDALADAYGFHPDLIAAIIAHESDEESHTVNHIGPDGMMGQLPSRSSTGSPAPFDQIPSPSNNMRWGMAILSFVVQQSGGDLSTALAAYHSGWANVNSQAPREYAARVLDSYARALIVRAGISPQMASGWTVAVEIQAGNVPANSLLILGNEPTSELRVFAEHIVYAFAGNNGHTYYIRGFVVPGSLVEYLPVAEDSSADTLEPFLRARLGDKSVRRASSNSRVLVACLLTMDRLRGQHTTRWYSPTDCPKLTR